MKRPCSFMGNNSIAIIWFMKSDLPREGNSGTDGLGHVTPRRVREALWKCQETVSQHEDFLWVRWLHKWTGLRKSFEVFGSYFGMVCGLFQLLYFARFEVLLLFESRQQGFPLHSLDKVFRDIIMIIIYFSQLSLFYLLDMYFFAPDLKTTRLN